MFISFDIGGTKTRIVASKDCKTFVSEPTIIETPKHFDDGIKLFKDVSQKLCQKEKVEKAVGGIAGPLDRDRTRLLNSPNIGDWIGKPLKVELEKAFDAPVELLNDTANVGLGEAYFGAGKGHEIVVYMTVSTGVGGVRIVNGQIDKNRFGFEPGHQIIDPTRSLCPNCMGSELEDLVSGTATAKRFGKKAYEVTDPYVWSEELPKWFGIGLANTIMHWSPDIVVLGGSMFVGNPAISVEQTEVYTKENLSIFKEHPKIVKAALGDIGGLYGGLAYVNSTKHADTA